MPVDAYRELLGRAAAVFAIDLPPIEPIRRRRRLYAAGREMVGVGDFARRTMSRHIASDPDPGIGERRDVDAKRAATASVCPKATRIARPPTDDEFPSIARPDLSAPAECLRTVKRLNASRSGP